MRIAALCGGLGGARLALALAQEGLDDRTTFITNVGDDWNVGDLRICPDTDAVLYALAGVFDEERGWGVAGDTFPGPRPGEPGWFSVGSVDRAHHERRAALTRLHGDHVAGTAVLAKEMGITAGVIPVTGAPVETLVVTADGPRVFQEWLVRDHAQPTVLDVQWPAAVSAQPAPGVVEAITEADVVIVSSSSPVASIEPVLRIPGVLSSLRGRGSDQPVVVVSPIVAGIEPRGERDGRRARARAALLAAWGVPHEPVPVLQRYAGWASEVILDPADAALAHPLQDDGFAVALAPILDQSPAARHALVESILGVRR